MALVWTPRQTGTLNPVVGLVYTGGEPILNFVHPRFGLIFV